MLLKDTLVMTGSARAVVVCVGDHTLVEKEMKIKEFNSASQNTPLQDKLERFGGVLGFFAQIASAVAFALFTAYWFINVGVSSVDFVSFESLLTLINIFQICLALLIVSVPEGLPLAISMALAFSFERLTEDNI